MRQTIPSCRALRLALCLTLLAGASSGCGGKGKKAEIHGKVTYKDAPVTGGTITFYSTDGKSTATPVTLKNDGTFVFSGAPTGKVKVTVETDSVKNQPGYGKGMKLPPGTKLPEVEMSNMPVYVQIPRKYGNEKSTTLECEVTGGKQEQNFDLTGPLP